MSLRMKINWLLSTEWNLETTQETIRSIFFDRNIRLFKESLQILKNSMLIWWCDIFSPVDVVITWRNFALLFNLIFFLSLHLWQRHDHENVGCFLYQYETLVSFNTKDKETQTRLFSDCCFHISAWNDVPPFIDSRSLPW